MFRSSLARLVSMSMSLIVVCAAKSAGASLGWILERDTETPSYAYAEPTSTNLNIDTVVLSCEGGHATPILQLQLFLKDDGPLMPTGALSSQLKKNPRAEIVIDGHAVPAAILFAGNHVVLADESQGRLPALSRRLVDAMASGGAMTLRLDLITEPVGEPAAFDGEAVIDLRAGAGGRAIKAVRRCAESERDHRAEAK